MSWINENETLVKCEHCGRFVAEGKAYYAKREGHNVYAYCDSNCADKNKR